MCARENRVGDAERCAVRIGAGTAEAQRVRVAVRDVRRESGHAPQATGVRQRRLHGGTVAQQFDGPVLEEKFAAAWRVVEVGVVPDRTTQETHAWHAADVERDTRARQLRRAVPGDDARVLDAGANRKAAVDLDAETQHGRRAGLQ